MSELSRRGFFAGAAGIVAGGLASVVFTAPQNLEPSYAIIDIEAFPPFMRLADGTCVALNFANDLLKDLQWIGSGPSYTYRSSLP